MNEQPKTTAGWYPDPKTGVGQRYWDGQQWTEQVIVSTQQYASPLPTTVPDGKGLAIASLILGLAGGFLAIIALIAGPLAVIFGSISISRSKARGEKKTMAAWGVALGAITFLYAVAVFLF